MIDVDPGRPVALVTQIFEAFAAKIERGLLPPGTRLPSVRRLAKDCSVSTLTVSNAYNRLVAEGHLEARRASGYFVVARPVRPQKLTQLGMLDASIDSLWLLQRIYEDETSLIKAGCGWLPESHLFTAGIKQGLAALAKKPDSAVSRYGHPLGYAPLRQRLQVLLAQRNIGCVPDQVMLTHGASQALELAARCLLRPGDTAFVDDPGYCNLFPVLRALGVRVVGVERRVHGPDVDALQALAERHRPKALFTNTNLHNPTGTDCSPAAAYRILRLAEQYDFHVVEDDIFADFVPETAQSIASLDQLKRVIYVGSFSKVIAPSLRVGYLACDRELAQRMLYLKMASGLTTSEITEQVVYAILTEGQHRLHVARLRDRLAGSQKSVCDQLASAGLTIFHRPAGGLFVWAGFRVGAEIDIRDVAREALADGIMLAPGSLFRPDPQPTPWLRFNVAHAESTRLYRFLEQVSNRLAA